MAISTTPSGVGNTAKPKTWSISGNTSNSETIISNYNKITLHFNGGLVQLNSDANDGGAFKRVLTQEGCYHNGQPMWTYADGVYDGDYDTSSDMGRLHHSDRFGSSLCEGKSLKLRWGGGANSETGNWEVVSHGKVSMYANNKGILNFFSIQGSGGTGMGTWSANSTRLGGGGWGSITATTSTCIDINEMGPIYGCFRDGISTLGNASLTAITTDGLNV